MTQFLGQRGGHGAHILTEILRSVVGVDADARDQVLQGVALALQPHLGKDAAHFFPVENDIIGPLDLGTQTAGGLNAVAHRHRHPGGKVGHLGRGQLGAQ